MAASLLRDLSLLRHRLHLDLHHHRVTTSLLTCRPWSTLGEPTLPSDEAATSASAGQSISVLSDRDPSKHPRWDDLDFRKSKNKEAEILKDIEPIISTTKEILHSNRYLDGECLTAEDEKLVVERLLAYHPHSEDKIGCGLDSIMVDRPPQYRHTRCLFAVRTDGGWIDFSYKECLQAYIREKYPSHADRFIKRHVRSGSG